MSPDVGIDYDNLAALMDIPYSEREEIRINYRKYPSMSSKAKHVLELFNESKGFDRHIRLKHLRRQDLKNEMPAVEDEVIHDFFVVNLYPVFIQPGRMRGDWLICHHVISHRCNVSHRVGIILFLSLLSILCSVRYQT